MIYEMASLNPPFKAMDMEGLYRKIQKGVFDRIPSKYSNDLQTIISMCLRLVPSQRPASEELLNHPLIIKYTGEMP